MAELAQGAGSGSWLRSHAGLAACTSQLPTPCPPNCLPLMELPALLHGAPSSQLCFMELPALLHRAKWAQCSQASCASKVPKKPGCPTPGAQQPCIVADA